MSKNTSLSALINYISADSSGKIGVGTTSPSAALDVVSVIRATNSATSGFASANLQLAAHNGSAVTVSGSIFQTSSTFAYQQILANQTNIYGSAANGMRLATAAAPIVFSTGNSDADFSVTRMIITSGGNVGIGTTTANNLLSVRGNADFGASAFSNPILSQYGSLTFPRGQIMFSNTNTQNQLYIATNAYSSSAGVFAYRNSSQPATYVGQDNGVISFGVAGNGTADASISWTTAMAIINSGNVGIGTANPSSPNVRLGQKLALVTTGDYGGLSVTTYAGASTGRSSVIDLQKSRGSSDGSMTAVANGDEVGYLVFRGSDGTNFLDGAVIKSLVDGSVSTNSVPMNIVFSTGGTNERMRITSGGNVGIGNSGLSALGKTLSVEGTIISQTGANGGNYNENIRCIRAGNGYSAIIMGAAYGTTSGTGTGQWALVSPPVGEAYRFYFDYAGTAVVAFATNGSVTNGTGSYGTISDITLKENIIDATPKLENINRLKVRNFNFIGDNFKQIGFVAQEIEEVFPNMVDTDPKGIKSVKTTILIPMLVKAIQEQQAQIEELKQLINN